MKELKFILDMKIDVVVKCCDKVSWKFFNKENEKRSMIDL